MIEAKVVFERRFLTTLERCLEGELPDAWRGLEVTEGLRRGAAAVLLRLANETEVGAMVETLQEAAARVRGTGKDDSGSSPRQKTLELWNALQKLVAPFGKESNSTDLQSQLDFTPELDPVVWRRLSLEALARDLGSAGLDTALRREILVRLLRARARVWADQARDEERARTKARRSTSNPSTHQQQEKP